MLSAVGFLADWRVGAVLGLFGLGAMGWQRQSVPAVRVPPLSPLNIRWPLLAVGALVMLGLPFVALPHHIQFGLLVVGIVLYLTSKGGPTVRQGVRSINGLLLAIVLLTFGLRVWNLDTAVHFFLDEVNFSNGVLLLEDQPYFSLLAPFGDIAAFPAVYPYWQGLMTGIFGNSLLALRLVSVVFGVLTVPAVYRLACELFDRHTALLAALILATFPPHIHLSRTGINNIADPFFGTFMLYFLVRGRGHAADFVLAGVMLGLTQYFYEGGRLLFPLLALTWLVYRRMWRPLVLVAAVGLLVAAPVYITLVRMDASLFQRFSRLGVGSQYWQEATGDIMVALRERFQNAALHYVNLPDASLSYGGDTPLVLVWAVPFFLLGIGYALWHPGRAGLPLMWLAAAVIGNGLIVSSNWAVRHAVGFPAVALLIAVGLRYGLAAGGRLIVRLGLVSSDATQEQPVLAFHLVPALALVIAAASSLYYFGPHLARLNHQLRPESDIQDAIFRSAAFPPGTPVTIITGRPQNPTERQFFGHIRDFIADHITLHFVTAAELDLEFMLSLPLADVQAFFVEPDDAGSRQFLRDFQVDTDRPLASPYDSVPAARQFDLYYTLALQQTG